MADDSKKIITDDDWKEQARKEKEKLKEEKSKNSSSSQQEDPHGPFPPASLDELVNMFALQAMLYMGKLLPPGQEKPQIDLELAKHYIDILGVIEEKTKGNLTAEEDKGLKLALHQMRMLFVDTMNELIKQGKQ